MHGSLNYGLGNNTKQSNSRVDRVFALHNSDLDWKIIGITNGSLRLPRAISEHRESTKLSAPPVCGQNKTKQKSTPPKITDDQIKHFQGSKITPFHTWYLVERN